MTSRAGNDQVAAVKREGWPLKHSFKLSLVPAVGRPGWEVGSDTRSRMGRLRVTASCAVNPHDHVEYLQ